MPWNTTVFDSTGKIKDARVPSGELLTASGTPSISEITAVGSTIEGTLLFPLVSTLRHASRAFAEDNLAGEEERAAIALFDACMIGMNINGPWDNDDAAYLTRKGVYDDIIARAAADPNTHSITLFEYSNVMEKGLTHQLASQIYAGTGPNGSDWWTYIPGAFTTPQDFSDVNKFGTFGSSINVNICPLYTTADVNGDRFSEVYATYIKVNVHDIHTNGVGIGGVNTYQDVVLKGPKKSGSDMNGNEVADDADDFYDPTIQSHLDHGPPNEPAGTSVEVAGSWRQGQVDYGNKLRTDIPGMLVIAECNDWSRGYASLDKDDAPNFLPEYVGKFNGGLVSGQSSSTFPTCGVTPDGFNSGQVGDWRRAHNTYTYSMDNTVTPNFVCNIYGCNISPTGLPQSPEGRARETNDPQAGTPFHFSRWIMASTAMDNGYVMIAGKPGSSGNSSPVFDEMGRHNLEITGLSAHWLGTAIDPPQNAPVQGTNIYRRRFTGGTVVVNSDDDETNPATTVVLANLGISLGTHKRIDGVQDAVFNNGNTVNGNFSLDAIDGIFLEII